jgi:hypothetical protein
MKIDNKTSKAFILCLAFASFLGGNKAEAGIVTITNNSEAPINMNIIPATEGIPYCWKCLDSRFQTCGMQTAAIAVPLDAFCGYEYFSVIDTENGFMASGRCENLNIFKNYQITFSDTTFGTKCESREIKNITLLKRKIK